MGTGKPSDRIVDEYLRGGSELSRAYQALATEQPRTAVDRDILSQAREAVAGSRPESKPWFRIALRPFGPNWALPASLAAVAVMSVTLVITLSDYGAVPVVSRPAGVDIETDRISVDRLEKSSVESRKLAPAQRPELGPAAIPELRQDKVPAKSRAKPSSSAPQRLLESAVPEERAPTPAAPALSAPPVDGALEQGAPKRSAEQARTPETWLEEIRELRRKGRHAEADAALRAFKKRYPDYSTDGLERGRVK